MMSWPIAVLVMNGTNNGLRWMFNHLTFGCWHLVFVPAMMALLDDILAARTVLLVSKYKSGFLVALGLSGTCAALIVFSELSHNTFEPYMLCRLLDGTTARNGAGFAIEMQARQAARDVVNKSDNLTIATAALSAIKALEGRHPGPELQSHIRRAESEYSNATRNLATSKHDHRTASDIYMSKVRDFKGDSHSFWWLAEHLSFVGWLNSLLTWLIVSAAILFVLHHFPLWLSKVRMQESQYWVDATFIGLFCVWIPLREYADWYDHAFLSDTRSLEPNVTLQLVAVVAAIGIVLLFSRLIMLRIWPTLKKDPTGIIGWSEALFAFVPALFGLIVSAAFAFAPSASRVQVYDAICQILSVPEGRCAIVLCYLATGWCAFGGAKHMGNVEWRSCTPNR